MRSITTSVVAARRETIQRSRSVSGSPGSASLTFAYRTKNPYVFQRVFMNSRTDSPTVSSEKR